jgi:hypothetical protein
MKSFFRIIGIVIFAIETVNAQDSVEFFGYYESQLMGIVFDKQLQHVHSNKLRVDMEYAPSNRVRFAANYNYISYHGKTLWNSTDYLSPDIVNTIDPDLMGLYVLPFEDRHFLDNANIKLVFERFDLTVGKQQISLGSGYVWNPTDVFNTKDVFDPTYEQPGYNAIRLDMPLGTSLGLTTLYSPEDNWDESGKLIQLKARIPRFDVSLIAIETQWNFHDYTRIVPETQFFPGVHGKRRLIGSNFEGELLGLGLWAEYAYNKMEHSEDFEEWVTGFNYTFDCQSFIMVEYYHNTLGKSDYKAYQLNDWMRYFTAEQKSIAIDQMYTLLQHPAADFIDIGLISITSLSDGSLALVPTLNWSYSENVDITAYANMNIGKSGTAYADDSGSGGLLRVRI